MLDNQEFIKTLNAYGKRREPFFFAVDFEGKEFFINTSDSLYKLEDKRNYEHNTDENFTLRINKEFVSFSAYKEAFAKVIEEIQSGNTYLLNLTFSTKIKSDNFCLENVFYNAEAPFKLLVKDRFVCFSPERFVCIDNDVIKTYPMKGTIDASIEDAQVKILENKKEMSEHVMVVDLLRNDLGIISKNVRVEKFRYISKINAGDKKLLQVSSEICGDLEETWHESIGDILAQLLPAGSITGTPKKKTVEIIKDVESHQRGFFTGVFGYYDGKSFDSAVMIRFIEQTKDGYVYKSGGGITCDSDVKAEYQEIKDKVYVPLF